MSMFDEDAPRNLRGLVVRLAGSLEATDDLFAPYRLVDDDGATVAFTLTPDANYVIGDVTGCGGALAGDVYTTGAITADCEVDATFVVDPSDVIFRDGFD